MSIPQKTTVLIIGGGPGGSYTASVLAREGIDTVLLESDSFPRYHIGESMLPSFRNYLRFVELDEEFDRRGFCKKVGAAFKMSPNNREGFTDFLAAGGPTNYTWNVLRSEADDLLFKHASKSGAKTFDNVKVTSVHFESASGATEASGSNGYSNGNASNGSTANGATTNPGKPISASYKVKDSGEEGSIEFDYVVDATGRAGLLNTKYLKNRHYNTALKNVAHWAYYEGAGKYGKGTERENVPLFEALRDESGWAWLIPLHNGTTSVGIVRHQTVATEKKRVTGSTDEYFADALTVAPMLSETLGAESKRVTEVKTASDYSYHSSTYAFPNARIVGDAGCFIDPFFSSGVHLALTGALAAATTICASIKGDVSEEVAAKWHTTKIREGYARFLLVVLSAYKQMMHQSEDVLNDFHEDNFDRAFSFFKPVIQGTVDATDKISRAEFTKTIEFMMKAFDPRFTAEVRGPDGPKRELSKEDLESLEMIKMVRGQIILTGDGFTTDVVEGRIPRMERGALTLVEAGGANGETLC